MPCSACARHCAQRWLCPTLLLTTSLSSVQEVRELYAQQRQLRFALQEQRRRAGYFEMLLNKSLKELEVNRKTMLEMQNAMQLELERQMFGSSSVNR